MRNILLTLLFASVAATVQADIFICDGISYETSGTECAVIRLSESTYNGAVEVPAEVTYGGQNFAVTAIADSAFTECRLEELTLPPTLRRIGKAAFAGCSHLNKLHIADVDSWCGIEFDDEASSPFAAHFYGSQQLWVGGTATDSITVNTDVPDYAFCGWECIRGLRFADSVTTIGRSAFRECKYINKITFGNGIRRIGENAFMVCEWLRSVETPSIAAWCSISFASPTACPLSNSRVERFIADGQEITDLVIGDDCATVGQYSFYMAPMITSVAIADGVSVIGKQAFFGCENLRSVSLGNGLTSLPGGLFMQCKNLLSVDFGESISEIGESAFSNCRSLPTLSLPPSLLSIGQTSFAFLDALVRLEIPSGVESLGQGSFSWCSALEEVTLPPTLKKVGFACFAFCDKLKKVDTGSAEAPEAPSTNLPFSSKAYADATLTVPRGSATSYRSAPGWKNFANIQETGTSSVSGICVGAANVTAVGGHLTVELPESVRWTVTDISGRVVASGCGPAQVATDAHIVIFTAEGKSSRILLH